MTRLLLLPLLLPVAFASTAALADDFSFLEQEKKKVESPIGDIGVLDEEDMFGADFAVESTAAAKLAVATGVFPKDAAGKPLLADNFDARLVHIDNGLAVVELMVLVSHTRADITAEYTLVGEVFADGAKVTEVRQTVSAAAVPEKASGFVFLKAIAPIGASSGTLAVKVSQQGAEGDPTALFKRQLPYKVVQPESVPEIDMTDEFEDL